MLKYIYYFITTIASTKIQKKTAYEFQNGSVTNNIAHYDVYDNYHKHQ